MKITTSYLKTFLDYARFRGISEQKISDLFLTPEENGRIEATEIYRVLDFIDEELGDELLGIKIGNFFNLKILSVVYDISLQAVTIKEAIFYLEDFVHKSIPIVTLGSKLAETTGSIVLSIADAPGRTGRILAECILTVIARELRIMSERSGEIKLYSPYYHSGYPGEFASGNAFSADFRGINLKAAVADTASMHLYFLVPEYLKYAAIWEADESLTSRIKIALLHLCKPALPDQSEICSSLNITPRTLQRMLAREGVTFRKIQTELKMDLAKFLLRHERYSISAIAYILGYAEPAAFLHAFKRWYNQSPKVYRIQQGSSVDHPKNSKGASSYI